MRLSSLCALPSTAKTCRQSLRFCGRFNYPLIGIRPSWRGNNLYSHLHADRLRSSSGSLNDIGQVAGAYTDAASNGHIFIRQPNGSLRDLGAFGIDPSALAINNQGRVLVGTDDGVRDHTYINRPGSVGLEEVPSLIPNGSVSPGDMNGWGVVVGSAIVDATAGNQHAYIYFEGKIKDLGVLSGGDSTWGYGINNLGQTVGQAYQAPKPIYGPDDKTLIGYTPQITHGWVSVAGRPRDVNGLLNTGAKGWEVSVARKVNDHGQVLADANFNGGNVHAVLLTPNAILPAVASIMLQKKILGSNFLPKGQESVAQAFSRVGQNKRAQPWQGERNRNAPNNRFVVQRRALLSWRTCGACAAETPGSMVGMYNTVSSFSGGMNSRPSRK